MSTAPSRALVAAVIRYPAVGSLAAPLLPFTTLAASLLPIATFAASLLPVATLAALPLPFATFAASLLPFATALVGVGTAYAGITLLGHAMTVAADFAPMLGGANPWLPRRLDKRMPRISNGLSEFRAARVPRRLSSAPSRERLTGIVIDDPEKERPQDVRDIPG